VQIGKWVKLPAAGPSLAAMDQAVEARSVGKPGRAVPDPLRGRAGRGREPRPEASPPPGRAAPEATPLSPDRRAGVR